MPPPTNFSAKSHKSSAKSHKSSAKSNKSSATSNKSSAKAISAKSITVKSAATKKSASTAIREMDIEDDGPEALQSTAPSDDRVRSMLFFSLSQASTWAICTFLSIWQDEHGQSILHFACARSHGKNALIQLIEESDTNISYRDELYRTCRDVSLQANQPDNAKEIDRYVLGLAARGDLESIRKMILDGYDHVLELTDVDGTTIEQVARSRGHNDLVEYLQTIREFEVNIFLDILLDLLKSFEYHYSKYVRIFLLLYVLVILIVLNK